MLTVENFVCECFGSGIPERIANIIKLIYNAIRIGVPLLLVIIGMIDMGKAITKHDESEIKKAQQLLVKKLIAGGLVFLMLSLVTLLISLVDEEHESDMGCVRCILSSERTSATPSSTTPTSTIRVDNVSFNQSDFNISVGETKEIYLSIFPEKATNKSLTFQTSNDDVADFSESIDGNGYKIVVKAKKAGTVKYTAISNSNNMAKASIMIQVQNSTTPGETVKETLTLNKVNVFAGIDKTTTITSSLSNTKWSSSDESVATVDSNTGVITGKKAGTAVITAKHDTQTASATIFVLDIDTTSSITISKGGSSKLKANILPSNDGLELKWSLVTGSEYLTIDESGSFKALKVGTAKARVTIYRASSATDSGATDIYKEVTIKIIEKATPKPTALISTNYIRIGSLATILISNVNNCNVMLENGNLSNDFFSIKAISYDANKKACLVGITGLKSVKMKTLILYLGKKLESTTPVVEVDKKITVFPDFLGKNLIASTSKGIISYDITNLYVHMVVGDRRSINCDGCEITYVNSKELRIMVDKTFNFIVQIDNSDNKVKFVNNSKYIEIEGYNVGNGVINVKSSDLISYSTVIDYMVYGNDQSKGNIVCFDHFNGQNINNLVPLKFNEAIYNGGSVSTAAIVAWGNETITLSFSLSSNALSRLKKIKGSQIECSDLIADIRVQAEIIGWTDSTKIPGLYRMQLEGGASSICSATFVRGTSLGDTCGGAKIYPDSVRLYYVKK